MPRDAVALGLILAAATALRLVGLGAHDFWYDEALEIARDRLPWPRILWLTGGPDPPLYRLLMSPLARRASDEAVLRLPSLAFSVGTIWLVACWLRRLGDARLALATAALLAIAPVQVHYAQEVSQYALAGFLAAASLLALQAVLDRGARRDWVVLGATLIAGLLAYYGLAFVVAAVEVVLLVRLVARRDVEQVRRFAVLTAALVACTAVLAVTMLRAQYAAFAAHNLRPLVAELGPGALLQRLAEKLGHDWLRFFWMPWAEAAPRWLLVLPGALALAGAVVLVVRGGRFRLPPAIAALGLGTMALAHVLGFYPFGFRYALFLSPLLFVFVAAALCSVARARPAVAIALGVLVAATQVAFLPNVSLGNPWSAPPRENLGHVLAWVRARADAGTPVYVYYGALPALRLYAHRLGDLPVLRGRPDRALPPAAKVAEVVRATAPYERFFLVASHVWGNEWEVLVHGLTTRAGGRRIVDAHEDAGAFAALLERTPR